MNETKNKPSAPEENHQFIPHPNLYPKIIYPEFDTNNYRINRIMNQYKFLEDEIKTRANLLKKYQKISNAILGSEIFITASEIGLVSTSIAIPIIIPFSVPIAVGLTTASIIFRTTGSFVYSKINKHSEIKLLAESKLNSIEEKFTKAIKDGKISDEEFNDIEAEIKNYNSMKTSILNEYNKNKKESKKTPSEFELKLKDVAVKGALEALKVRAW